MYYCLLEDIVENVRQIPTKLNKLNWIVPADLFCMAVCVMLCFSCVLNFKRRNEHTRVFVGLLTTNAMAMFLDEAAWLVQGIPQFRTLNLIINVLFYMNGVVLIYEFWQYVRRVLKMENSLMRAADSISFIRCTSWLTKTAGTSAATSGT